MNGRALGIALVVVSVCVEAFGQVALKKAAMAGDDRRSFTLYNWLGIGLLGLEAVVWTLVLGMLDVSIAFPMGALSFATTALFSQVVLKEKIEPGRWLGILTIIFGTIFLAMS